MDRACPIRRVGNSPFLCQPRFPGHAKGSPIYPGPGVTRVVKLSTYYPTIAGTDDDSEVYFLEGDERGGTALLVGGTHPDESAGTLAAVIVIENAVVKRGRVIVIPRADHSAFTHTQPLEAYPQTYSIKTQGVSESSGAALDMQIRWTSGQTR